MRQPTIIEKILDNIHETLLYAPNYSINNPTRPSDSSIRRVNGTGVDCADCHWEDLDDWSELVDPYRTDIMVTEILDDPDTSIVDKYYALYEYLNDAYLAHVILYELFLNSDDGLDEITREDIEEVVDHLAIHLNKSQLNNILRAYLPYQSLAQAVLEAGACLDLSKPDAQRALYLHAEQGNYQIIRDIHERCPLSPEALDVLWTVYYDANATDELTWEIDDEGAQFFAEVGAEHNPEYSLDNNEPEEVYSLIKYAQ